MGREVNRKGASGPLARQADVKERKSGSARNRWTSAVKEALVVTIDIRRGLKGAAPDRSNRPGLGQWEALRPAQRTMKKEDPMSELTDTQLVILSATARREDGAVLPVPGSIKAKGGALANVMDSMISRGLIYECPAGIDDQTWREAEDGSRHTLRITETGRKVIGVDPVTDAPATASEKSNDQDSGDASPSNSDGEADDSEPAGLGASEDESPKMSGKQTAMIALLTRQKGATIAELTEATGWQAHSVRGAISGTLKKKLGYTVTSEKIEGRGRVYRIAWNL